MKRRTKKERIKKRRKGVDGIFLISWASSNIHACLGYRWTLLFTFYPSFARSTRDDDDYSPRSLLLLLLLLLSSSSSLTKLEDDVYFVFPFVRRSSFLYPPSSRPTNDVKSTLFLLCKKILCPFILNTSRT